MLEEMQTSTFFSRKFGPLDYLKISILGFALAALANAMHSIILPLLIEEMSGPDHKSTYLGWLTFAGLIVAMLVQPIVGSLSDRTVGPLGRRKPFILTGICCALVLLFGCGWVGSYVALLVVWCFLQASLNIAQGPFQAYIPDLAPRSKAGLASGLKNLLEIAGGVALLSLIGNLMGHYNEWTAKYWLWLALGVLGGTLLITMLITVLSVHEKATEGQPAEWSSLLYRSFNIHLKTAPAMTYFLVSRLLFLMGLTTLQTFALYYFKDVMAVPNPAKITADLITAVGVAMIAAVYPAGRFSDKIGRRALLIASGVVAASGVFIIFLQPGYIWTLVAGAVIGLAGGTFLSVNWALATDLVPPGQAAQYLGLANLASAGGGALARLIGPLIDIFNRLSANMGYSLMLGACVLYFLLSAMLIWKIRLTAAQPKI
jgi:MFS family permease